LPGSVHLRQGVELGHGVGGEVPGGARPASGRLGAVVAALAPQRHRYDSPYEQLRAWLRLRRELGAASGYLGVRETGDASLHLALDNREVVLALGPEPVAVPEGATVTHSSRAPVRVTDGSGSGDGVPR